MARALRTAVLALLATALLLAQAPHISATSRGLQEEQQDDTESVAEDPSCPLCFAKSDQLNITGAITSVTMVAAKARIRRPTRISAIRFLTSDGRTFECGRGPSTAGTREFRKR